MDRIEKTGKERRDRYANQAEVAEQDRPLLPTSTGREPGVNREPTVIDEEIQAKSIGTPSRDTAEADDSISDGDQTTEGLTLSEQALRQAAENAPSGADPNPPLEKVPVFDRGELPPKI